MHNASAVSDHSSIWCIKCEKWKEVDLPLGCIWRNWESSTEPLVWHLFPSTASTITSTYNHTFPYLWPLYLFWKEKENVHCSLQHFPSSWPLSFQFSGVSTHHSAMSNLIHNITDIQTPETRSKETAAVIIICSRFFHSSNQTSEMM